MAREFINFANLVYCVSDFIVLHDSDVQTCRVHYRKYAEMTIQKRSVVMGVIVIFLAMLYGAAKYNSTFLVEYTVEQTLIQKAPPGTDPVKIRQRLQELLIEAPDQQARIGLLFRISGYLEKVQTLSLQDLADLMEVKTPEEFGM